MTTIHEHEGKRYREVAREIAGEEQPLITTGYLQIFCEPLPCTTCNGEGRIADSEDGEPWSLWESLPPGSDLAVRMGIVKPITCPACGGVS